MAYELPKLSLKEELNTIGMAILCIIAVPIFLIDGNAIVELMLEKKFGFQTETILLPTYSLDLALDD